MTRGALLLVVLAPVTLLAGCSRDTVEDCSAAALRVMQDRVIAGQPAQPTSGYHALDACDGLSDAQLREAVYDAGMTMASKPGRKYTTGEGFSE
jgi:hypothetical protein